MSKGRKVLHPPKLISRKICVIVKFFPSYESPVNCINLTEGQSFVGPKSSQIYNLTVTVAMAFGLLAGISSNNRETSRIVSSKRFTINFFASLNFLNFVFFLANLNKLVLIFSKGVLEH